MSEIIAGNYELETGVTSKNSPEKPCCKSLEVNIVDQSSSNVECCIRENNVKLSQSEQVCQLVHQLLQGRTSGKVTIEIEVEFSK